MRLRHCRSDSELAEPSQNLHCIRQPVLFETLLWANEPDHQTPKLSIVALFGHRIFNIGLSLFRFFHVRSCSSLGLSIGPLENSSSLIFPSDFDPHNRYLIFPLARTQKLVKLVDACRICFENIRFGRSIQFGDAPIELQRTAPCASNCTQRIQNQPSRLRML